MIHLVLLAAGSALRYGEKKQFVRIAGKELWQWSLERFINLIDDAVVVVPEKDIGKFRIAEYAIPIDIKPGGKTRLQSSYIGTKELTGGIVLIHDAARPLVSSALIKKVIDKAKLFEAAVPVVSISDTIKLIKNGRVVRTVERDEYKLVQTPQGFKTELIKEALENAVMKSLELTDDAAAVELIGRLVYTVEGEKSNIKLTYQEELKFIKQELSKSA